MNKNDKPHNSHYPYKLLDTNGKVGCYEDDQTAKEIGRPIGWYQIIHYQRGLIDSSD